MPTSKEVSAAAADPKKGMTLDELASFVQEAMKEGVDGSTLVKITATWFGSIKKARVTS